MMAVGHQSCGGVTMKVIIRPGLLALALSAGLLVACSDDDPTGTENSPLAGLSGREGSDSIGNPLPPEPTNPTPGSFHGTVLGPADPSQGGDTLATAPRVSGVVVTAYPLLGGTPGDPQLGQAEATVTTGADGKFQLPELSGGEYVVTFRPPSSSNYGGVWIRAFTSAQSNEWPWWVVLSKLSTLHPLNPSAAHSLIK
jgi:hypothetical protein